MLLVIMMRPYHPQHCVIYREAAEVLGDNAPDIGCHTQLFCNRPLRTPRILVRLTSIHNEHKMSTKGCFNVEPPSVTAAQH